MSKYSQQSAIPATIDIRSHLKVALIDLEATRAQRRAGCAAGIPRSDMRSIDRHLTFTTNRFNALMQELVSCPETC